MAKIERKNQKIFSGNNTSETGIFGSAQSGSSGTNPDLDVLQSLPAYERGWGDAVISGEELPPLEEFNGLNYINTSQLSYLFQEGIAEYNVDTTYYINSIVKETGTVNLYKSLTDDNIGNDLTDIVNWELLGDLTNFNSVRKNVIINGGFDIWQRGTSFSGISGPSDPYVADRFRYRGPDSGTGEVTQGILSPGEISSVEGLTRYAIINRLGDNAWIGQRIEGVGTLANNVITISFYARAASNCTISVLANQDFGVGGVPSPDVLVDFGGVNLTTSWERYSVTSFIPSILGKVLGTNADPRDHLLVYLGESSTDNIEVNITGLQVEKGASASEFQEEALSQIIARCQRYYEKTFNIDTTPVQNVGTTSGGLFFVAPTTVSQDITFHYSVRKRVAGIITTYNPYATNSNWSANPTSPTASVANNGERAVTIRASSIPSTNVFAIHVAVDSEL